MSNKRFETIYTQGKLEQFKVLRDNETGVLYMSNYAGAGGGLTVMVDQEGKPLVDEDFKK
ncbi:DUF6440 family protein [Virgibacillus necropolis]|uniref:DUF6440 family protein n=1 Tax=Virgibacillus necropolis TaxID=163877 RepID=UPI00384FA929